MTTTRTPPPADTPYVERDREPYRRNRLTAVAAWVGIVAGTVFIVAVIFFTGFILGAHAGGHEGGGHHGGGGGHHWSEGERRGGPPMGQWQRGPGGGPGQTGPGSQSSSPSSTPTTTPSR